MSINTSRETKRLNDTVTKIAKTEESLKKGREALNVIDKVTNELLGSLSVVTQKIDALNHAKSLAQSHIEAWQGKEGDIAYPEDELKLDGEQIKAADESLARLELDKAGILDELKGEQEKTSDARSQCQVELNKLDSTLSALIVTKFQQEEALKKQEAEYPKALARHLRRCRRFGWTDARLTGGKKK